jgi:hypothetical protein
MPEGLPEDIEKVQEIPQITELPQKNLIMLETNRVYLGIGRVTLTRVMTSRFVGGFSQTSMIMISPRPVRSGALGLMALGRIC